MSSTSAIDVISDPPGTATNVSAFSFASLLARVKVWFEPCSQLFILVQQAVSNVYRECDPLVLGLTLAALAIALFGMVAIYCQCRLWKRAKQQRPFDTSSWLEYNIGRSRLHDSLKCEKKSAARLVDRRSSLADTDDDLHSHPSSKYCALDIDQCQLVQSFMKLDSNSNCDTGHKKKPKTEKCRKKKKKSVTEKKKVEPKSPPVSLLHSPAQPVPTFSPYELYDSFPFYASASVASSTKVSRCSGPSALSLQTEYETQTIELNLTGSEDGDSLISESGQGPPVRLPGNKPLNRVTSKRQQMPDPLYEPSHYYSPATQFNSEGNFSKNPLYSEICEFSLNNADRVGSEGRKVDQSSGGACYQPQRQLTYSTFQANLTGQ